MLHHRGLTCGKVVLGYLTSSLTIRNHLNVIVLYVFALLEKLLPAIVLTRPTFLL